MAGPITIAVLADVANARRNLGGVEGDLDGLGGKSSKVGAMVKAGLAAGGVALAAFGVQAVKAASDSQQSLGATETVFGKFSAAVVRDSKAAAQEFGLSANEYRENANLIGSLFKNQGVAMDQLGGKTKNMIGLGSDLAATFGGTTKEAVEALGSAFKGEFDPLEKYGISIKQSTVNAELAARGQDKLTGAALKQAQQIALTDLVMKQAADSQGAFAKESNTLAGQTQRLGAQWENIKATVGTALLPVLTALAATFNETVLPAISAAWAFLSTKLGPVFATVKGYVDQVTASFGSGGGGGLAGAVATVQAVFGQVVAVVSPIVQALVALVRDNWTSIVSWTRDTFGQIRSTVASYLTMVRTVITTVLGVIRAVWNTWGDEILSVVRTVFTTIGAVIRAALNIVQGIIRTVTAVLRGDWSGAWEGIKQITRGAVDAVVAIVKGIGGLLRAAASAAWDLVKAAFRTGVDAAVAIVKGLPGLAVRALSGAGSALVGVGQDIVRGLISGIQSIAGDVGRALLNLLPGPLQKFAGKLGINSPSRVFAEFGRNIGQGLVVGVDSTRGLVSRSITDLVDPSDVTLPSLPSLRAGAGGQAADDPAEILRAILRALQGLPRSYRLNERTALA
jgi:hypothetical protein